MRSMAFISICKKSDELRCSSPHSYESQHSANTEYFGCHVNSSTMTWYDSETEFLTDFAFLLICCGEYLMFVLVLCQRERDGT